MSIRKPIHSCEYKVQKYMNNEWFICVCVCVSVYLCLILCSGHRLDTLKANRQVNRGVPPNIAKFFKTALKRSLPAPPSAIFNSYFLEYEKGLLYKPLFALLFHENTGMESGDFIKAFLSAFSGVHQQRCCT